MRLPILFIFDKSSLFAVLTFIKYQLLFLVYHLCFAHISGQALRKLQVRKDTQPITSVRAQSCTDLQATKSFPGLSTVTDSAEYDPPALILEASGSVHCGRSKDLMQSAGSCDVEHTESGSLANFKAETNPNSAADTKKNTESLAVSSGDEERQTRVNSSSLARAALPAMLQATTQLEKEKEMMSQLLPHSVFVEWREKATRVDSIISSEADAGTSDTEQKLQRHQVAVISVKNDEPEATRRDADAQTDAPKLSGLEAERRRLKAHVEMLQAQAEALEATTRDMQSR